MQLLRFNILDTVAADGADGHVRHIGGSGLDGASSIEAKHWQM